MIEIARGIAPFFGVFERVLRCRVRSENISLRSAIIAMNIAEKEN
jgi:hypothetical protein